VEIVSISSMMIKTAEIAASLVLPVKPALAVPAALCVLTASITATEIALTSPQIRRTVVAAVTAVRKALLAPVVSAWITCRPLNVEGNRD
jgi:hypothetical protein